MIFSFSPFIIPIPFCLVALVIGFFALINIAHLIRTGNFNFTSFVFTLFFLVYSAAIIYLTYNMTAGFDWQTPITVDFSSFSFSSNSVIY